jgi:hypothetical protein
VSTDLTVKLSDIGSVADYVTFERDDDIGRSVVGDSVKTLVGNSNHVLIPVTDVFEDVFHGILLMEEFARRCRKHGPFGYEE